MKSPSSIWTFLFSDSSCVTVYQTHRQLSQLTGTSLAPGPQKCPQVPGQWSPLSLHCHLAHPLQSKQFNPTTSMCCLCLKEKFLIMFAPVKASLNKRSEVYASCWHRLSKTFFLLVQKTECFLFNHFCTLDDFVQLYSLSGMDLVFFFLQQPFSLLHPHILLDFMYHKSGMRIFIKSLSKFSNKPYMQRCILNHALPY